MSDCAAAPETSRPAIAGRRYCVFISYSHADTKWANWLLKKLEGYRVPARFHGRAAPIGEVGARLAPVFRDRDELPTTSDLGETIRAALRESATLIVICSPSSAKSRWVQEEIVAFKRLHGPHRVFALIVAGEPKVEGAADDCFSPALRRELAPDGTLFGPRAEVVAADARPHGDGRAMAFVRLVAGLLGVGFDELRQRELQRRNRRLTLIAAASVVGMVLTLGLAFAAWRARGEALLARNEAVLARNDAQRRQDQAEDTLAFMLGDFRDDLKKVGQLSLLEKVGNKAQAYFDTANARDLTDTALTRQAKALSQIGEVRLLQKDVRYAEAEKVFVAAYQRASELAARHPRDGDMLYERAQAEYWIGHTYRRRGDLEQTATWFGRYRDSAAALVALDPASVKWQRELISGHHNLAALDVEREKLAAARAGFLAEIEAVHRLLTSDPKNTELRYKLADIDSFLGNIAAHQGDFAESLARFVSERKLLEALLREDAGSAPFTLKLAEGLIWESVVLGMTGRRSEAGEVVAHGQRVLAPLVERDPSNRRWQVALALLQLREAELTTEKDLALASKIAAKTREHFERTLAAEPTDLLAKRRLMASLSLEARLRLEAGGADAAVLSHRAVEIADTLALDPKANGKVFSETTATYLVAGRVAAAQGRTDEATTFWQRVVETLAPHLADSRDKWALDPAARALLFLGRTAEADALTERLQKIGYVPPEPWPHSGALPRPQP